MKTEFKAKDIQTLVGITKSRYDYLNLKIGIKPEIREVEGTGRSHAYSFKNLMQFAISDVALNLAINPHSLIIILQNLNLKSNEAIYSEDKDVGAYFFVWRAGNITGMDGRVIYDKESGDSGKLGIVIPVVGDEEAVWEFWSEAKMACENDRDNINYDILKAASEFAPAQIDEATDFAQMIYNILNQKYDFSKKHFQSYCDGYVEINVSKIKTDLLKKIG
jgi:hypothetical protein